MPADHTAKAPEGHFPARYWKLLDDGRVECEICPRRCRLANADIVETIRSRASTATTEE